MARYTYTNRRKRFRLASSSRRLAGRPLAIQSGVEGALDQIIPTRQARERWLHFISLLMEMDPQSLAIMDQVLFGPAAPQRDYADYMGQSLRLLLDEDPRPWWDRRNGSVGDELLLGEWTRGTAG